MFLYFISKVQPVYFYIIYSYIYIINSSHKSYSDFNATFLGPPGGFSAEFYGWKIYDDKLWINAAKAESDGFFAGNVTQHIEAVNAMWISWFGSLDEGVINFACITDDTKNAERYCESFGQPYAPAANPQHEIYPIMEYTKIDEHLLSKRGL